MNAKQTIQLHLKSVTNISQEVRDLIEKLTEFDPEARPSAKEALDHIWFKTTEKEDTKLDKT